MRSTGIGLLVLAAALGVWAAFSESKGKVEDPESTAQFSGDLPSVYDQLVPLHWSGGSFAQLRARLATQGCLVNSVAAHTESGDRSEGSWYLYNQFEWPHSLNVQFLDAFRDGIPSGQIWVSCYDICDFRPERDPSDPICLSFEDWADAVVGGLGFAPGEDKQCGSTWHPFIIERLLPLLPVPPGICIAYPSQAEYSVHYPIGSRRPITGFWRPMRSQAVTILTSADVSSPDRGLYVQIHELCHASQSWEEIMTLSRYDPGLVKPELGTLVPSVHALIALLDYRAEPDPDNWHWPHTHKWTLPAESVFRDTYSDTPVELGAELCTMYVYEVLDPPHAYPRGNIARYLTDEIREWLGEYVFVLPH